MSESLVLDRVYRSYFVTILGCDTRADLIVLDILDFYINLIIWLFPYHIVLDYFTKTITLAMYGSPLVV